MAPADPRTDAAAMALGEAMQMTNFLRDVAEDWQRGRIYLPVEDMEMFGVREVDIAAGEATDGFRALVRFEIERTRALYAAADPGIPLLPPRARKAVTLARVLYSRILDRIEAQDCDVFRGRARTSRIEKAVALARVGLFG
jgi:15-cis-phytoene synthase